MIGSKTLPFGHEKSMTELTPGESYTQIAWVECRPQQEEGIWGSRSVGEPSPIVRGGKLRPEARMEADTAPSFHCVCLLVASLIL